MSMTRRMPVCCVVVVLAVGVAMFSGCGGEKEQPQTRQQTERSEISKQQPTQTNIAELAAEAAPPAAPPPVAAVSPTPTPLPPGALSGLVLDDLTSAPIPIAKLRLSDAFTTSTEALDGAFSFGALPLGDYAIRGGAEGYSTATLRLTLTEAAPARHVAVRLTPQSGVSGRVVDKSGAPIADASVYISHAFHMERNSTRRNGPATTSTLTGEFLITGVRSDSTFNVVAQHPDYATNYKGMFKLAPGHREEGIVIVLEQGGAVRGIVRDAEGAPIAGAEVRAGDASAQLMGNSNMMRLMVVAGAGKLSTTNDEGAFEYTNLPPAAYLLLASHDGYQSNYVDNVLVKSSESVEGVEIVLAPGAIFSGVVQNGRGEPVANARINVSLLDLQKPVIGFEQTDDEGRFRFDTLRPGNFMLQVEAEGYPQYQKMSQPVPQEDAVIVLPDGGRLIGRVTSEIDGKPLRKFTVRVKKAPGLPLPFAGGMTPPVMPTSKTFEDADGRYEIMGLETGLYIVMVMADDYAPAQKMGVMIEDGKDTTEDFSLNKGLVLKGRVVDAKSREPIAGAVVKRVDSGDAFSMFDALGIDELSNRGTLESHTTNVDGEFTFAHLAPGTIKIQVSATNYVNQTEQATIEADEENEIEILMERGATIQGRVVDAASGDPISGAKVSISGSGMFGRMLAEFQRGELTGADGVFTMRTIPEGKAGLVVVRDGYAMLTTDKFTVYNNQDYNIGDLKMTGGGRIAGLVSKAKQPITGAAITAMGPSGIKMTSTGDDGRYEIAALEAGTYQVSLINSAGGGIVMGGNMQTLQKTTSVKEGETTELDFELPGGFNLTGVVRKGGQPLEGWMVMYGPKGGATAEGQVGGGFANTDAEGHFSFSGLTNGEYQVSVTEGMSRPGAIPIPAQSVMVTIEDADAYVELTIPGAALGGVVVDEESGQPVSSVAIHLFEEGVPYSLEEIIEGGVMGFRSAQTDGAGRFIIENLEAKTWEVVAQHEDYSPGQMTVVLGDGDQRTDLQIALKKGATLHGRAYAAGTGVRVPRLTLQFYDAAGRMESSQTATTDAQGNFTVTGLPVGTFRLEAFAENYAPIVGRNIDIAVGSASQLVLEFPDGGTLALTVTDAGGAPLNRARAQITLELTGLPLQYPATFDFLIQWQAWTYTNEAGRLTHPYLPAGSHLLRVTRDGYEPQEARVDIIEGQTTTLGMQLKAVNP